jgi:flagellar rod assembly protein/muramidase FlgJ
LAPEEFVALLKPYAKSIQNRTGIHWAVIIAQAALETGWLRSLIVDLYTGRPSYNLFNIKGKGPAGSVQAFDTEYVKGRARRIIDEFRAYHNYEESLEDYVSLLTESNRYKPALAVGGDPEAFARKLQELGYAQDPRYAEKLIMIMRKYMKEESNEIEMMR